MSSDRQVPAEFTETGHADEQRESSSEGQDPLAKAQSTITRLQDRLARAERVNGEALPYIQTVTLLQQSEAGRAILAKVQKGEPLTPAEGKKVEQAAETSGQATGVDPDALLQKAAQMFEQRLLEQRRAEKEAEKLNAWASKELAGYDDIHSTPEWNETLDLVLQGIQSQRIRVPDDEPNPYQFAIRKTYKLIAADHPELGKPKPAKKTEEERRGAISRAQGTRSTTAGQPKDESELPDWARLDVGPRGTGGRSFSSLKRN